MRKLMLNMMLMSTALSLAACGGASKAEEKIAKGQVVATVNGEDVTIYELNADMEGIQLPSGADRKQVERAVLQRVIDRKILADIARERGLDKTPEYLIQSRRANEGLLVQLLQRDTAGKTPNPTDEDAEKFIAANPAIFGDRKILVLDQIQFPIPNDRDALKALQPLKTLEQIEAKLTADNVEYRRVPSSIDTMQLAPAATKAILALPAGEVFIVPAGGALTANKIVESRSVPLIGNEATAYAKTMVRRDKVNDVAKREFEQLMKTAREKVTYQTGYAPPKPAAGAAK